MPASSAIQQSLSLLLPSHSAKLPPQLVHLSESLLAQSRQRASHLKPEEEIARTYACCEIACKRLRSQCRLPAVKAGSAPCKPAVYKKLVTFLERVLEDTTSTSQTPIKAKATPTPTPTRANTRTSTAKAKANTDNKTTSTAATKKRTASEAGLDDDSGSEAAENDELATPSKKQKTPSRTPAKNHKTAFLKAVGDKNKKPSEDIDSDRAAPAFVMPSIRKLCKTFRTPLLAPHVYTGTCIVLQLTGLWPQGKAQDTAAADGDHDYHDGHDNSDGGAGDAGDAGDADTGSSFQETVTGLLIAIYLLTLTRMQTAKMTTSVYKATCSKSVQELGYSPGTEGVEAWIRRINREGYCRGQEWWASVPESVFDFEPNKRVPADADAVLDVDSGDEDDDEDRIISAAAATRRRHRATNEAEQKKNHDEDEEEQEDPPYILLPGLATMMQPAVDFTSDERTRDFEIWKRALLRKLDRLEKAASNTRRSTGRAVGARTGTATRTGRAKAVTVG
ncbi:hypothetical protein HRR83_004698 [Exophiala dermatitidis]|uniref:ORC6 first cyclin-like domain-containing protein n=1 Tax=Exophiala dermatitidis TaxID=5970 RepID=A0AAN6EYN5_EXODE|nr:hypothetical protein HRR75_003682 [Exophiala dermatitidis]KAJ4519279.1 hypothetical protein HRR74_004020 [Exophiala dermatitidis]KAJ4529095.1 hypothetical protein HRR73_000115 [Exophiala dermatitidis]KAJ4538495.1 hypothetical protein HRR77_006978 [Exophiala dermatitidis]KAJ4544259.1 hypothetical protein HRR76_002325 [Exophiala dermatitidis]